MPEPKRGRLSKEASHELQTQFGRIDTAVLASKLGRTVEAVRARAAALIPRRLGPWSAADVAALRARLGKAALDDVALSLGRDRESVQGQLERLAQIPARRKSLARVETLDFRRRYGRLSDEHLCAVFNMSAEAVRKLAALHCLAKDKAFLATIDVDTKMPRWKPEEIEVLKQLYPANSNLEVARRLSRSVKSVVSKAHQLGLRKTPQRLARMGRENRAKE